jgi:hypothetical protein
MKMTILSRVKFSAVFYFGLMMILACGVARAAELPNPGFEAEDNGKPAGWQKVGGAHASLSGETFRSGRRAAKVSDAGQGLINGWQAKIPVEPGRQYALGGYIKTGKLRPNSPINGGYLAIQFATEDGQLLGDPVLSQTVIGERDWTFVRTPTRVVPRDAAFLLTTVGLSYCEGDVWFDDLVLFEEEVEKQELAILRRKAEPDPDVHYADNLLKNGRIESGEKDMPAGWTYHGKAARDWSEEQIRQFHDHGRPRFDMGRGEGSWSHEVTYEGEGALCNRSIDPPLSDRQQWYGRTVVDGYWLSSPMPCEPGKAYMAAGWILPGREIESPWFGPLEIRFYNKNGRQVRAANDVRSGLGGAEPGQWIYWPTMPHVAPKEAETMRLRFGQELVANSGGWGKTYADNLVVWELPEGVRIPELDTIMLDTDRFMEWFKEAIAEIKPPYMPSPERKEAYRNVWGKLKNSRTGNLFRRKDKEVELAMELTNLLGESREVSVEAVCYDWEGDASKTISLGKVVLDGYSSTDFSLTLPPTGSFGAFYLSAEVKEGEAGVGKVQGRYAVLPQLDRPRTGRRIWGVTTLFSENLVGNTPYQRELSEMLKIAGFQIAWIRMMTDPGGLDKAMEQTEKSIEWYRSLGIDCVLQLRKEPGRHEQFVPESANALSAAEIEEIGRRIGKRFRNKVLAFGNWGIEQSNCRTPENPTYRPTNPFMTDEEYDAIYVALYKGLKSAAPDMPVLIGNIATDPEAKAVRRMYGPPVNGRFDGAIINAYSGLLTVVNNTLAEFDRHGDTEKTVWQEENADQRSPISGPSRRYEEKFGPRDMVRTWLNAYVQCGERLKAMTMWGFVGSPASGGADIIMVTSQLQPRPQFVAHAVMANALGDVSAWRDLSGNGFTFYEFQREDSLLYVLWGNVGSRAVTLQSDADTITVMDLMGNSHEVAVEKGVFTIEAEKMPIYLSGGRISVSKKLDIGIGNGTREAGSPRVSVRLQNKHEKALRGQLSVSGPITGDEKRSVSLESGETKKELFFQVSPDVSLNERHPFQVTVETSVGTYGASKSLVFGTAVHTADPPSLDGAWKGWGKADVITFGKRKEEVWAKRLPSGENYEGPEDILGRLRLMWDEKYLYLGVEAQDDKYVPRPERGIQGFAGDSIEFAVQPENLLTPVADRYEFEVYRPAGAEKYCASRRSPLPQEMITDWEATISQTGRAGDVNYQVAIPWSDIGIEKPEIGKTFSFALVLNDSDAGRFTGDRVRIRWFRGLDTGKDPSMYGDVTLVAPKD